MQLGSVIDVDSKDVAVNDIDNEEVVGENRGVLRAVINAAAADNRAHGISGVALAVGERTVRCRDFNIAGCNQLVEIGCRLRAVVDRGLFQLAAIAAFIERPAEIGACLSIVDLFPGKPAGLRDEKLAVVAERHHIGIAQSHLPNLRTVGIEIIPRLDIGIVGQARARHRINAQNLAG